GLGSLAYGLLIPVFGTSVLFYVYSVGMALFAVVSFGIPKRDGNPINVVGTDALRLVKKPDFVVLLVSAFLVGTVLISGNDFFSVYMREIGASDSTT
ncbi:MAG: MFS transporter, partial [Halobacteria archaeon]|nr:MFS transporter [Halobacteria archaeon]